MKTEPDYATEKLAELEAANKRLKAEKQFLMDHIAELEAELAEAKALRDELTDEAHAAELAADAAQPPGGFEGWPSWLADHNIFIERNKGEWCVACYDDPGHVQTRHSTYPAALQAAIKEATDDPK